MQDTGQGIPKEDIGRIFDEFYRSSTAKNQTGVGLGLAIVNAIVRAHGGRVTVESEAGKGSTFKVHLPIG